MAKTPWEIRQAIRNANHKKKGCDGKRKYLDESSAQSRADWDKKNLSKRRFKDRPDAHRPYRCVFCGCWHIGTMSNPNFRPDYQEVVSKGHAVYQQVFHSQEINYEFLYSRGLIRKEELKHGSYYLGWCRDAKVARWHAEEQLFFYVQRTDEQEYEKGVPYPSDRQGVDYFVAISPTQPYYHQVVYAAFGEDAPPEGA